MDSETRQRVLTAKIKPVWQPFVYIYFLTHFYSFLQNLAFMSPPPPPTPHHTSHPGIQCFTFASTPTYSRQNLSNLDVTVSNFGFMQCLFILLIVMLVRLSQGPMYFSCTIRSLRHNSPSILPIEKLSDILSDGFQALSACTQVLTRTNIVALNSPQLAFVSLNRSVSIV